MPKDTVPYAYRRDIPWDFELDNTGDLKMKEDIDAVNQAIYTILMSNFNDKNFEATFGSNMESVLFEQSYPEIIMKSEIEDKIRDSLSLFEPDIQILDVQIDLSEINNYIVKVTIPLQLNDGITKGFFEENLSFVDLKR